MSLLLRILVSAGAIALFTTSGLALLQASGSWRRMRLGMRLSLGYLLGLGASTTILWTLSFLFGAPLSRPLVVVSLGMPALVGLELSRRATRRSPDHRDRQEAQGPRTGGRTALLAGLLPGVVAVGLFADAVTDTAKDFDGRMTWMAAVRYVRDADTVIPRTFAEKHWYITHPQYPLVLPLSHVMVRNLFGLPDDDRTTRAIYAAFFPAYLVLLCHFVTRFAGSRLGRIAPSLASVSPVVTGTFAGAGSTYADLPLATFLGGGFLLLFSARDRASAGLAGTLLAAAALTKTEGLPLALVALLAAALGRFAWPPPGVRWKTLLVATVPVVLGTVLYKWWGAGITNRFDEDYSVAARPAALLQGLLERGPLLPAAIAREMLDGQQWGAFWVGALLLMIGGYRALRRPVAVGPLLMVTGACAIYGAAYLVTPWPGTSLVHPTWSRFLVQMSLPGLVLVGLAGREVLAAVRRGAGRMTPSVAAPGDLVLGRAVVRNLLVLGVFLVLACLATWPWVSDLGGLTPNRTTSYLGTWVLWHGSQALVSDPLSLLKGTAGLALPFHPLLALGIAPLKVHGIATLMGIAFAGFGAYRATRALSGSTGAAWISGVAYGCVPFRFDHLSDISYAWTGWIPLLVEAAVSCARSPSRSRAAWLVVALALSTISSGQWFALVLVPLGVTFLFVLARSGRMAGPKAFGVVVLGIATAGAVFSLVTLLLELNAVALPGLGCKDPAAGSGVAVAGSWVTLHPRQYQWSVPGAIALMPGVLMGLLAVAAVLLAQREGKQPERGMVPTISPRILMVFDVLAVASGGVVALTLTSAGRPVTIEFGGQRLFRASEPDRALILLAVVLAVRWWFAFPRAFSFLRARSLREMVRRPARLSQGLVIAFLWVVVGVAGSLGAQGPLKWVQERVVAFGAHGEPIRWAMLAYFGLSILAGYGAASVARELSTRFPRVPEGLIPVLLAGGMLVEFNPVPLKLERGEPFPDMLTERLRRTAMRGSVLHLPPGCGAEMYRSLLRAADHGRPLASVVLSGDVRREIERLYALRPIPESLLDALEVRSVSYVVVHETLLEGGERESLRRFLYRGIRDGRVRFMGRFEEAQDLYAVLKTEPSAPQERIPPWRAAGNESSELTGSLDAPSEGEVVRGPLVVRGWARVPGEDLDVTIELDGEERRRVSAKRVARPDVCAEIAAMGATRSWRCFGPRTVV